MYSYSDIVKATLQLVREKGWSAVTTRAIARQLGSSTMPIYSHVKSIDDLAVDVRKQARRILQQFQQHPYTSETLLNLAIGYVAFARDEANLFRFIFLECPEQLDSDDALGLQDTLVAEFGKDSEVSKALGAIQQSGQEQLIQHTWIFVHGLAVLANSGNFQSISDEKLLRLLQNAGQAFHLWSTAQMEEE